MLLCSHKHLAWPIFRLEAESGVVERTKTTTRSSKASKASHRNPAKAGGAQELFPAWLLSPPGAFGHILLFQHSPECLSITRRNWGNRGGLGWSGKGAGITLCHTPDCLDTNKLLPAPNPALLCTWPEAAALRGGRLLVPVFVFLRPGEGALALPNTAGSLEWANTARPRAGSITGSKESKVQVCLDLDLGVSFL